MVFIVWSPATPAVWPLVSGTGMGHAARGVGKGSPTRPGAIADPGPLVRVRETSEWTPGSWPARDERGNCPFWTFQGDVDQQGCKRGLGGRKRPPGVRRLDSGGASSCCCLGAAAHLQAGIPGPWLRVDLGRLGCPWRAGGSGSTSQGQMPPLGTH